MQGQSLLLTEPRRFRRKVWYTGTDAIQKGEGVCFERTRGTATDTNGERDCYVARPTTTNNRWFAGVAANTYTANSAGQLIEIYEPGSVCEIAILAAATIDGNVTCVAGSGAGGRWSDQTGFEGRGTARLLETQASAAAANNVIGSSIDGSATYTTATKTITKTAAFTNIPATASLTGDEYVYVVGGVTTNSAAKLLVGRYKITAKTSNDAVIIEADIGAGTDGNVAFYCVRGNPLVLAELLTGTDSGMVEYVSTAQNAASQAMVGGRSIIIGGVTVNTGATTSALASGTYLGQKKAFLLTGALTTNGYAISVTGGKTYDPPGADINNSLAALATITLNTANEYWVGDWDGISWVTRSYGPDNSAALA